MTMRRAATIAILVLCLGLVVSNLWWLYVVFDAGVSYTYLHQTFDEHHRWIAHNLSEDGYPSDEMINARAKVQEILDQWEQAEASTKEQRQ
jgi:hypothetical protein